MRSRTTIGFSFAFIVAAVVVVEVPDWQAPVKGVQLGPGAISMVQFASQSPWRVASAPIQAEPQTLAGGPGATEKYKNVTVLTDVTAAEFDRLQTAMTAWVSPQQGCGFCHVADNFASDDNPMKNATRDMLRMTRTLNTTWKAHVGENGVTCFSCHRGEPVPPETWFPIRPKPGREAVAQSENWDETADTVRKFFPDNAWSLYLLHDEPIRAESTTALRSNTVAPQVDVKRVYELMMQMSDGIGVNCTYCHNSRSFSDWSLSPPARWIAHDAIKMMRDINVNYLLALHQTLPQTRQLMKLNMLAVAPEGRVPLPDGGLAVCATCHYGVPKPDGGAATLSNYGALGSAVNAQPTQPLAMTPISAIQK